jgi:hypothetical protein
MEPESFVTPTNVEDHPLRNIEYNRGYPSYLGTLSSFGSKRMRHGMEINNPSFIHKFIFGKYLQN